MDLRDRFKLPDLNANYHIDYEFFGAFRFTKKRQTFGFVKIRSPQIVCDEDRTDIRHLNT